MALLDIDSSLEFPDFRAGERTFQLLVQAAGRAGRGGLDGQVYLQGHHVGHKIIEDALNHDFESFAENELKKRKILAYPPFKRSALYEWTATKQNKLFDIRKRIERGLDSWTQESEEMAKAKFLGPSTPGIARVKGRYRLSLVVLFESRKVVEMLNHGFGELLKDIPNVQLRVDVDPTNII